MHYRNGSSSSFVSPSFKITREKLYAIRPDKPLLLDLNHHSWHIIGPNDQFIAAFSNYDCAMLTADHYTSYRLDHLDHLERVLYISSVRIVEINSGVRFAKAGSEWVPVE